jgi:glutamate dehydrogenase/leucine dehydrogenase
MGRKSALAGLWHGGGKGVIAEPESSVLEGGGRKQLFREYGEFITSLRGCYIAAEDSGVNVEDMDIVYSKSRFTTCISPALGGSGNPSVPTAEGVSMAMEGLFFTLAFALAKWQRLFRSRF